jgi:hypothetical protein
VKVLVCGSRQFSDSLTATVTIMDRLASLPEGAVVIHGGALGADKIAAEVAADYGHEVHAFYADWDKHGKKAGIIRNLQMLAERPDLVIAFWNGSSRGTGHTITEARRRNVPVEVIPLA